MSEIPDVSVVMPTYRQAAFIPRAIASLLAQHLAAWELIVVVDGPDADTEGALQPYLSDPRVRVLRLPENRGFGAAVNAGLDQARSGLIAYLPSDDVYYPEHLASLLAALAAAPGSAFAYSGVRHGYNRMAAGAIGGGWLQAVQVLHQAGPERWLTRDDLVTDNLDWMFWNALRHRGPGTPTGLVTCEWVDHPAQRHKLLREPEGGINAYRQRYGIARPLRFHTSVGNRIDEEDRYRRFRERPDTPPAADGLRVLLAGELAYNAERVLALEERGHTLYGAWMPGPYWCNTIGPLPFGHVTDLDSRDWRREMLRLRPDVIYALLNWQAVPFCGEVRAAAEQAGIPFVWHFKDGPFICLQKGTWPVLQDLYSKANGVIYCSEEMRDWCAAALSPGRRPALELVLDGDLPKREWFDAAPSPRLSDADGEVHTVVPGRPIGLHPETVGALAAAGIHLHFYGDFTHGQWLGWIDRAMGLAPGHLHLHEQVDQDGWVREFSRYDAGWLHVVRSENAGDIRRATWDDLNLPARLATYAAAGLPVIQRDNTGAAVATQRVARELDIGLFFTQITELASLLADPGRMDRLAENARRARNAFTFDAHADVLVQFFRDVATATSRPRAHRRLPQRQGPNVAGLRHAAGSPEPRPPGGGGGRPVSA